MSVSISSNGQPLDFVANLNLDQFRGQANQLSIIIQNNAKQVSDSVAKQSQQIEGLAKTASAAIGTYLSFAAAGSFIQDVVRVRGEFQALSVAFETMLGSKQKADKLMAEAVQLAAVTPFTLQEVGTGAKQLLAYGFAANTVTKNLETLGNIAAGVGAPLGDIVYLYGTLRASGKATQVDLQQFAGRGIPIYESLAKVMGVVDKNGESATEQIRKLTTQGKVGFPEVEKAFNSLTSAGGQFFNLMQEQSKTLTGQISNLQDAWSRMLNEIGSKNQGVFSSALSGAISVVDNYKKVVDLLELIVIGYGSYKAAVVLASLAQVGLTGAELLQYGALELVRKAQIAFNAAMAASPVAAFTLVLSALAAVVVGLNSTIDAAVESQKNLLDIQAAGAKSADQEKAKTEQLLSVLKDKTANQGQQVKALEKLREVTGEHLKQYTDEQIKSGEAKTGVDEYIKSIEALSIAKAANAKIDLLRTDLVDLKTKGAGTLGTFERLGLSIKSLFGAGNYKKVGYINQLLYGDKADEAFVEDKVAGIQKQIEDIGTTYKKEISDALKADLTGNKPSDTKAKAESLKAIDDLIAKKREEQGLNSTTHAEYLKFQKEIDKLEAQAVAIRGASKAQQNAENASLQEKKKILEDIASLQRDSQQSGLLKEQSEIDKINEKYEKLFATINGYNKANPKNKIGQSVIKELTNAQTNQVSNLTAKEQAEKYRESIEAQKQYFDDFVQYQKDQLGDKAQDVYQTQLQGFKTYVDFLKAELAKLDGRTDIGSEQSKVFLTKAIANQQAKDRDAALKKEVDDYKSLIDLSETFTSKRAAIETKYSALYNTLEKNRTKLTVSEVIERFNALQEAKKEELDLVTKNEVEKSDVFKRFEKGFDKVGITATAGILKGLKDLREQLQATGKDVSEVDKAIKTTSLALNQKSVSGIKEAAGLLRNAFKDMNIQVVGQLKITAGQISDALENVATLMSKDSSKGQQIGSIIGLISFVVVGIRDALLTAKDLADPLQAQKDYYSTISNEIAAANELLLRQKKILDDLSGLQKIQLSANYLDDLNKKQDQALKSLKEFRLNVIASSKEVYIDPVFHTEVSTGGLNALADIFLFGGQAKRKLKLDLQVVDTSQLSSIEDFAKLLNEIKAGGGKLNGKTVVEEDIKSLQLLIDTYDQTVAQQKEFKLQFEQLLTGTTADSITDSIVDGFKNGLRSATDFANTFQDLMKNAVFQSLKIQALEGPLKAFYEQFAKDSASDNVLTEDEIRQLKANFNGIISEAGKKFDQLQQITKLNLSSGSAGAQSNSLAGQIKAVITEDTGTLIAGQFGAMRLTAGQQLDVSSQQLNVLNSIQANTAYLVTYLPSMDRRLSNLEMNGIKIKP